MRHPGHSTGRLEAQKELLHSHGGGGEDGVEKVKGSEMDDQLRELLGGGQTSMVKGVGKS